MANERDLTPIVEQFKTLREEIHIRIKLHAQFVVLKIVAIGAVASFFFDKPIKLPIKGDSQITSTPENLYLWLLPFIAIIFDLLIAGNLRSMYNIGPYIKMCIEPIFKEKSGKDSYYWEETVASYSSHYRCYKASDLVVIWLLTFVLIFLVLSIQFAQGMSLYDWVGIIVSIGFAIFSLIQLISSVSKKRKYPINGIPNNTNNKEGVNTL